jgi:hypothetical protein
MDYDAPTMSTQERNPDLDFLHSYRFRFAIGVNAIDSDPVDYIVGIDGEIIHFDDEGRASKVGTLSADIVRTDKALDSGESLLDVFDAHSHELRELYATLFDPETQQLKEFIDPFFGGLIGRDLLVLNSIEIQPRHRGRNLGLAAAYQLFETFEAACALAICEPFPLQFSSTYKDDVTWRELMGIGRFTTEFHAASAKLQKYCQRLGFRQIANTPFLGLSLELVRPTLTEVVGEQRDGMGSLLQ